MDMLISYLNTLNYLKIFRRSRNHQYLMFWLMNLRIEKYQKIEYIHLTRICFFSIVLGRYKIMLYQSFYQLIFRKIDDNMNTEIMKCKWYKSTSFLCDIDITFLLNWSSAFTDDSH